MKVTKILALIIALAMSLTLTACGETLPNNDPPANNQDTNAETPDNGTETPPSSGTSDTSQQSGGTTDALCSNGNHRWHITYFDESGDATNEAYVSNNEYEFFEKYLTDNLEYLESIHGVSLTWTMICLDCGEDYQNIVAENSGNDPGTGNPNPGNGGDVVIPDNGTPPYVEPPLESHRGDKGYFFIESDDYIVFAEPISDYLLYSVVGFDENGRRIEEVAKRIFADEEGAKAFADQARWWVQIDNIVYIEYDPLDDFSDHLGWWDKESLIDYVSREHYDFYISKP